MASELKPCPFCGSNRIAFRSTPDMDTDGKYHRISCNECGAGSREKFAMETCPLFYEELRNAWNTRPAPAATDTGLVTATDLPVNYDHHEAMRILAKCACKACGGTGERNDADVGDISFNTWECTVCHGKGWDRQAYFESFPKPPSRPQAAELLAAERAKTERWHKKAMDAGVIVHSDGTTSHPMRKERDDLKADNAAKDARIKELEAALDSDPSGSDLWRYWSRKACEASQKYVDEVDRAEALEAKLAAAEKALEPFAAVLEDYDPDWEDDDVSAVLVVGSVTHYGITLGDFRKARAVLGGKPL